MTLTADSLERLKPDRRRLAAAHKRAVHHVTMAIDHTACRIALDSADAAAEITGRYRHLLTTRPPERVALAVREHGGRGYFWAARLGAFGWPYGPLDDSAFAFLADAVALTEFFTGIESVLSLHAAAVGNGDACVALIGDSNAGKSTTALACTRRGLALYSDERCVVSDGVVHPFPRAINIRAGGSRLLIEDAIDDTLGRKLAPNHARDWNAVDYTSLFERWEMPPPKPLVAAILLCGHSPRVSIEPAPANELMRAALPWVNCTSHGLDRFARIRALFTSIACFRMTLGSPDASAVQIAETLHATIRRSA